jgi:hypothetical protein
MTIEELKKEARGYIMNFSKRGEDICNSFNAMDDMNNYCKVCQYSHVAHVYKHILTLES